MIVHIPGLRSMPHKSSHHRRSIGRFISKLNQALPRSFVRTPRAPESSTSDRRETEAIVADAHGSLRAHNPLRSWRLLSEWLKSRGDRPEDYAWLTTRIADWNDGRFPTRLTQARVSRLLALERGAEALQITAERMAMDSRFRPRSAADTLILAQLAARNGTLRSIATVLLSDFAVRFKEDPRALLADKLRQRLSPSKAEASKSA
jgi:hypothetical protein